MGNAREPMISYAQNGEDVLLRRLFGHQAEGFYLDVGASDPTELSLTRHFYDRGWHGVNVEPVPDAYARLCAHRPRDVNLNVGLADRAGELTFYEVRGQTVLSTFQAAQAAAYRAEGRDVAERPVRVTTLAEVCARYADRPIDFLSIDVEGLEREVLAGGDWKRWRPRVVLLEATLPNTDVPCHQDWEPLLLEAGYLFAYFDGLNRFYVRGEEPALLEGFRVPVNVCDNYVYFPYYQQVEDLRRVEAALRERAEDAERHLRAQGEHLRAQDEYLRQQERRLREQDQHLRAQGQQLQELHAEMTNTHAALAEARGVIDTLVRQVQDHRGWLQEAQARLAASDGELSATRGRLAASRDEVTRLQVQLGTALFWFTQGWEAVERLVGALHAEQEERARAEAALAPYRGLGPVATRIAHLLRRSSGRFPALAHGVKSVLRGTARVKRLVARRAA